MIAPPRRPRASRARARAAAPLLALSTLLPSLPACGGPASAASAAPLPHEAATGAAAPASPAGRLALRVTAPVAAPCGLDAVKRHPASLADLDGDGRMERASVTREGGRLSIHLHEVPGLRAERAFTLPGDYAELAVARHRGRATGDLWIIAGVAQDPSSVRWTHGLYHLEGGALKLVRDDLTRADVRVDLDGDGRADPIVLAGGAVHARIGGAWATLPGVDHIARVHGLRAEHGLEEAVDLDGDGDRDLLVEAGDELRVVELPSLATVWSHPGRPHGAAVAPWSGGLAISATLDDIPALWSADASHRLLARLPEHRFATVIPDLDPAGDGSLLLLGSHEALLLDPRTGQPAPLGLALAGPAHDAAPRLGPARLDRGGELLGVRTLRMGDASLGGQESGEYELVVLPPPGRGPGAVLRRAEVPGELSVRAGLLDLDGDGRMEILLEESGSYMNCDLSTGGGGSTILRLLDGRGAVLWQDVERAFSFGGAWRQDRRTSARAIDLTGDGALALRLREGDKEWYVLPAAAALREIPVCLE